MSMQNTGLTGALVAELTPLVYFVSAKLTDVHLSTIVRMINRRLVYDTKRSCLVALCCLNHPTVSHQRHLEGKAETSTKV